MFEISVLITNRISIQPLMWSGEGPIVVYGGLSNKCLVYILICNETYKIKVKKSSFHQNHGNIHDVILSTSLPIQLFIW